MIQTATHQPANPAASQVTTPAVNPTTPLRPKPAKPEVSSWDFKNIRRFFQKRHVYLTLAILLIVITVGVTYSQNRRAASIISQLGEQQTVLVAARDFTRGEEVALADVISQERPVGFIPEGALEAAGFADASSSFFTLSEITEGEVLLSSRVVAEDSLLIPLGTSAVAIPTGEARPPLTPGDRVNLIGSFADGPTGEVNVQQVATSAVVVSAADRSVTVAIAPPDLGPTVRSLTHGTITIALLG